MDLIEMKFFLVGAIVMCFLIGGWAYYQHGNSDPFACTEADGKTLCAFKGKPRKPQETQEYVCEKVDGNVLCKRSRKTTVQYKDETYALHYFDGKEVYVAE